ncbi:hypothetical protein [Pedobacter aquatilis]|uniref:hypothetical protein n=1 Tax=Pedobacter aquatilis TaxID=351343 RepID=UPI00292E1D6A|nr:hypothetical protein [Pedobacter aquatilis]
MIKLELMQNRLPNEVEWNEKQWVQTTRKYKNLTRAKRYASAEQKKLNPLRESMYFILVNKVKLMYQTLPNNSDRVVVEIPLKKHPIDTIGIHSFISRYFYFQLECDVTNNYIILYKFHNCPFEEDIYKLMKRLSLKKFSKEANIQDYPSYYKRVLQVQPERFILELPYNNT